MNYFILLGSPLLEKNEINQKGVFKELSVTPVWAVSSLFFALGFDK